MSDVDWTGFKIPKKGEVGLKGKEYEKFRNDVFERDNWTCRNPNCRSHRNLTLHHLIRRSKQRLDIPENAMTLCAFCHTLVTDGKLDVITWKRL